MVAVTITLSVIMTPTVTVSLMVTLSYCIASYLRICKAPLTELSIQRHSQWGSLEEIRMPVRLTVTIAKLQS